MFAIPMLGFVPYPNLVLGPGECSPCERGCPPNAYSEAKWAPIPTKVAHFSGLSELVKISAPCRERSLWHSRKRRQFTERHRGRSLQSMANFKVPF